jgi:hypothetical protein
MKKWIYIAVLFPISAMAGDSTLGNFLGKIFPSTTERVTNTVQDIKAPGTGEHLTNTITNRLAPTYTQPSQVPTYPAQTGPTYAQPATPAPVQDKAASETLVRCMYMGNLIDSHTKLSEESVESQEIVERTKKLYAGLKCNDALKNYTQVIKQVDQAVQACPDGEDCETGPLASSNSSGQLKK